MASKFQVGDVLMCSQCPDVRRRIVEVRDTGYEWEYPGVPDKTFRSEDSNDPRLFWWKKV